MVRESRPRLLPQSPSEKCSRDLKMQGHLLGTPIGDRHDGRAQGRQSFPGSCHGGLALGGLHKC